jgi:hypothetical protein
VAKVQHYRDLGTNLENLYNSIKTELETEKNLQIVSEYKGELNDIPLRSIVAVNKSLKVFASSLHEIHASITGTPDDYAEEVASGAWFGSILFPGAVGLIIGVPIGLAGGAAIGGIIVYEFEKNMWKKILDVVKRESKVQPTIESIDHYYSTVAYFLCMHTVRYANAIRNMDKYLLSIKSAYRAILKHSLASHKT